MSLDRIEPAPPVASPARPGIEGSSEGAHPVTIEVRVRLQALAIPEPTGGYSIIVPALPGCFSDAETIEEAQANAVEAAELWLAAQHDDNREGALRAARG